MTDLQREAQAEIERVKKFLARTKMIDNSFGLIPGVGWAIKAILACDTREDWHRYIRELEQVVAGTRYSMPDYPDTSIS